MSKLKVGDKVVRKYEDRNNNWADFCGRIGIPYCAPMRVSKVISEYAITLEGRDNEPWSVDCFRVVSAPAIPEELPTQKAPDAVNSPKHYASGEVECIDAIKASMSPEAFRGYLKGNVQKYLWRYEKKVAPLEDLHKAQVYLRWLIEANQS